jgi:hypothetical protein
VFEAEGEKKWRLYTGGIGKSYVVYAPALPPHDVPLLPFYPQAVNLATLRRPGLVLIRIAKADLTGGDVTLVLRKGDGPPVQRLYRGGVVWVGVSLPDTYLAEEFMSIPLPLNDGDCLKVAVQDSMGPFLAAAERIAIDSEIEAPFEIKLMKPRRQPFHGEECL